MSPSPVGRGAAGVPFPALGTTALPAVRGAAWFAEVVDAARAAAGRLPMPTPQEEAWRFTDIAQIARQSYLVDTQPLRFRTARCSRRW